MTQKNNNNTCIYTKIILSLWKTIYFKQFNCSARERLIISLKNAIQYDFNLFIEAFQNCISQSSKFSTKYVNSIIEFFQFYGNSLNDIEKMLKFVIDNVPGNANIDVHSFNHLVLPMAQKKALKKINK